jgi:predicted nuclease of predicted toxin-antitoxin system
LLTSEKYNFLLDENVSIHLKRILIDNGHNVKTIQDLNIRSIKNNDLIKLSRDTNCILITYDKDFLHVKYRPEDHLIIVDIHPLTDDKVLPAFEKFIKSFTPLKLKDNILILYETNYKLKKKS